MKSVFPRRAHGLAIPEKVCTFQSLAPHGRPGTLMCIGVVRSTVIPKRYAQVLTPEPVNVIWENVFADITKFRFMKRNHLGLRIGSKSINKFLMRKAKGGLRPRLTGEEAMWRWRQRLE